MGVVVLRLRLRDDWISTLCGILPVGSGRAYLQCPWGSPQPPSAPRQRPRPPAFLLARSRWSARKRATSLRRPSPAALRGWDHVRSPLAAPNLNCQLQATVAPPRSLLTDRTRWESDLHPIFSIRHPCRGGLVMSCGVVSSAVVGESCAPRRRIPVFCGCVDHVACVM